VAEVAAVTEAVLAEEASMAVDLVVEASMAVASTVEGFAEDFTADFIDVRL
jgi:hypothetical protein